MSTYIYQDMGWIVDPENTWSSGLESDNLISKVFTKLCKISGFQLFKRLTQAIFNISQERPLTNPQPRTSLLDLPTELRVMILGHCISKEILVSPGPVANSPQLFVRTSDRSSLDILLVSKQIKDEIDLIFWQRVIFSPTYRISGILQGYTPLPRVCTLPTINKAEITHLFLDAALPGSVELSDFPKLKKITFKLWSYESILLWDAFCMSKELRGKYSFLDCLRFTSTLLSSGTIKGDCIVEYIKDLAGKYQVSILGRKLAYPVRFDHMDVVDVDFD